MTPYSSISSGQLIRECAQSDADAPWAEFVRRFQPTIALSVVRTINKWGRFSPQLVEDLVQETYLRLYKGKCQGLVELAAVQPEAIPQYIKTIAINIVHDHFKSAHALKRGHGKEDQLSDVTEAIYNDHPARGDEKIERIALLGQIDDVLGAAPLGPECDRDRTIFWLHYQQGMSAKLIASLPNVEMTPKGVESVIFRLTRLVRDKVAFDKPARKASFRPPEEGFSSSNSY